VSQVTLWNTGDDAYRHEVYGDWLTIERVIKSAGGTQYKLLNSQGKKARAWGAGSPGSLPPHAAVDARCVVLCVVRSLQRVKSRKLARTPWDVVL
jgi:hypothetical protein